MNELQWKWVYIPYLDAPEKQEESARFAGYGKVYFKSKVDVVVAEKDKEIAELKVMLEERNNQATELKGDIADLRDDKKLTDAILDECNAEIAEVKKAYNDNLNWCLHTLKEIRHHKYKRCLDKVKWCDERIARYSLQQEIQGISWRKEIEFYRRLRGKYLELAEKFKEAK